MKNIYILNQRNKQEHQKKVKFNIYFLDGWFGRTWCQLDRFLSLLKFNTQVFLRDLHTKTRLHELFYWYTIIESDDVVATFIGKRKSHIHFHFYCKCHITLSFSNPHAIWFIFIVLVFVSPCLYVFVCVYWCSCMCLFQKFLPFARHLCAVHV